MKSVKAFVERNPVLAYLVLVFAISWSGILLAAGPGEFPPSGERFFRMIALGYIGMVAGPSIAGLLLTGIISGRAGLRDLLSRSLRWRVGLRWYAVALLTAPLAILGVLLALSLISPAFIPRLFVESDPLGLLQFSVIAGLLTGVFEELGWTGFVVALFLRRGHSVLWTGLVVGVLYAAWDSLVVYGASPLAVGTLPLAIFLPLSLFTWLPAYRVLMVWVYSRTGSVLLAMLMATSQIAFWTSLTSLGLTGTLLLVYYLILTAVFLAVAAAFAVFKQRPRSEQPILKRAA